MSSRPPEPPPSPYASPGPFASPGPGAPAPLPHHQPPLRPDPYGPSNAPPLYGGAPGFPPPQGSGTGKGSNGVGLAALLVGIVALVLAFLPFASFIAWLPALIAVGLGITGLVLKNRKRGTALTGLILGGLALIVAIVVSVIAIVTATQDAAEQFDEFITDPLPGTTDDPFAPDEPLSVDEAYGDFEPVETSGTGNDVVELPAGALGGIVTATHDGASLFSLVVLDANDQPTGDFPATRVGAYDGTTAFGVLGLLEDPAKIEITADGAWTLQIAPMSEAQQLTLPAEGSGDAVFLYDGEEASASAVHDGGSSFLVTQYDGSLVPNFAVIGGGSYDGELLLRAGPSVVTIVADGEWSISP